MTLCAAFLLVTCGFASGAEPRTAVRINDAYFGNYRITRQHQLGINRFVMDDGASVALLSDYSSGVVRRLFPVAADRFVMGSGFNTPTPAELTLTFVTDARGGVKGISLRDEHGAEQFAHKVAVQEQRVSFQSSDATLDGTLLIPPTRGPRPAIILLHGSGPLTRYSFGPYPQFFSSLGFAVLIYDKRGAGSSTGTRVDASTGIAMENSRYPDRLVGDALAAMRMLQRHADIDPERIGFFGSSEGGMLATQVAARSQDVAFAINSSGFMEPLWQTLRYQAAAIRRSEGATQAQVDSEVAFVELWLEVARTGQRWDEFDEAQRRLKRAGHSWVFESRGPFTSLEQLRWDWDHVLSFDPLVALEHVRCPVLALFGAQDPLTPAARTAENMRRVLAQAGHEDFTFRIFPQAGHSLSVMPEKDRMAPGVFETLRDWLQGHVQASETSPLATSAKQKR